MTMVLKNAIDWGSRPWGTNSFDESTAAFLRHYMEEYGALVERVLAANAPGRVGDPHPDAEKLSR